LAGQDDCRRPQPGYKSRLQYSDADYFNLSEKDVRVATARREQVGPTVEQVKHVITLMPAESAIQRRDRALVAFTLLTGARDRAIASMKLKHVNLEAGCVEQDAREVKTKFSKTFTTYFFPVGDETRRIVEEWVAFLREEMLWGNDDPIFPATRVVLGLSRQFEAVGAGKGALEQRRAHPHHISGRIRQRRPAILQPAQLQKHPRSARAVCLPYPRGVQGVEPESWA